MDNLVADLITASLTETHRTTQQLIETLQDQLATARARERCVEEGVLDLFSGDYMPTPMAVQRALFPTPARVKLYKEMEAKDDDAPRGSNVQDRDRHGSTDAG